MSIKKCKECGGEVSTKADACPHCGAKQSSGPGCLTAIAIILVIGALGNIVASDRSTPTTPQAPTAKAPAPTKAPPPPPQWEYGAGTEGMSGKTSSVARLRSINTQDFAFPYGPAIAAELMLRNHPRYGKDVIVTIDKGQILCRSYEPCEIMIRFDDKPARKFTGSPPADHSTNTVFISSYARFLNEAKASSTIMIELPIYQEGNRVWMFSSSNLDVSRLK